METSERSPADAPRIRWDVSEELGEAVRERRISIVNAFWCLRLLDLSPEISRVKRLEVRDIKQERRRDRYREITINL